MRTRVLCCVPVKTTQDGDESYPRQMCRVRVISSKIDCSCDCMRLFGRHGQWHSPIGFILSNCSAAICYMIFTDGSIDCSYTTPMSASSLLCLHAGLLKPRDEPTRSRTHHRRLVGNLYQSSCESCAARLPGHSRGPAIADFLGCLVLTQSLREFSGGTLTLHCNHS